MKSSNDGETQVPYWYRPHVTDRMHDIRRHKAHRSRSDRGDLPLKLKSRGSVQEDQKFLLFMLVRISGRRKAWPEVAQIGAKTPRRRKYFSGTNNKNSLHVSASLR
jgi:hypothetical protein